MFSNVRLKKKVSNQSVSAGNKRGKTFACFSFYPKIRKAIPLLLDQCFKSTIFYRQKK